MGIWDVNKCNISISCDILKNHSKTGQNVTETVPSSLLKLLTILTIHAPNLPFHEVKA